MCKNVIKLATSRLTGEKKAEFNCRLTRVRAAKRQRLWVEQDGKCHYCDSETILPKQGTKIPSKLLATLDHIITQAEGGTDSLRNMVIACASCNNKRGDLPYDYFLHLMRSPEAMAAHQKKLGQEKAKRDEARRAAGQARHDELVSIEQAAARERRNERLRKHAPNVIKKAIRDGEILPEDPEERIQWAIQYHLEQARVAALFGTDAKVLLNDWINRANLNPRKAGKGWIAFQDSSSMSPYPWKDLTGDTESYIGNLLQT